MTIFDQCYYAIFSFYKERFKQKANSIALIYVSLLQISLIFLLGVFFAGFFQQMHMVTMSSAKAWALFILLGLFIHFKNWMQYTGKRRMVIKAKMNKRSNSSYNVWILWVLPVAVLGLAYVVFQAI